MPYPHIFGFSIFSPAHLNVTIFLKTFTYRYPIRKTEQVCVFELNSRALIAVIDKGIESGLIEFVINLFSSLTHLRIVEAEVHYRDLIWGQRHRKDNPVTIMVLLDSGSYNTADTDTVTAHDQRQLITVTILEEGLHRF